MTGGEGMASMYKPSKSKRKASEDASSSGENKSRRLDKDKVNDLHCRAEEAANRTHHSAGDPVTVDTLSASGGDLDGTIVQDGTVGAAASRKEVLQVEDGVALDAVENTTPSIDLTSTIEEGGSVQPATSTDSFPTDENPAPIDIKDFTLALWDGHYFLARVTQVHRIDDKITAVTAVFVDPHSAKPLASLFSIDALRKPYRLSQAPANMTDKQIKATNNKGNSTLPPIQRRSMVLVRLSKDGPFVPGYVYHDATLNNKTLRWTIYLKSGGSVNKPRNDIIPLYIGSAIRLDGKKNDVFPRLYQHNLSGYVSQPQVDRETYFKNHRSWHATNLPAPPPYDSSTIVLDPVPGSMKWHSLTDPNWLTANHLSTPVVNAIKFETDGSRTIVLLVADAELQLGGFLQWIPHKGSKQTNLPTQKMKYVDYAEATGIVIWLHLTLQNDTRMMFGVPFSEKQDFICMLGRMRAALLTWRNNFFRLSGEVLMEDYGKFQTKHSEIVNSTGPDTSYKDSSDDVNDDADNDDDRPTEEEMCDICSVQMTVEEIDAGNGYCEDCVGRSRTGGDSRSDLDGNAETTANEPGDDTSDDGASMEKGFVMDGDEFREDEDSSENDGEGAHDEKGMEGLVDEL